MLFLGPQNPRKFKLRPSDIGSIIPSLAKARYNNNQAIDKLCTDLLQFFKDDFNLLNPTYLKMAVERLISLEFKYSPEA